MVGRHVVLATHWLLTQHVIEVQLHIKYVDELFLAQGGKKPSGKVRPWSLKIVLPMCQGSYQNFLFLLIQQLHHSWTWSGCVQASASHTHLD